MSSKDFHDLLFEMSNEIRYEILQTLQLEEHRLTDLTKQFKLTTTEIRRHISRLVDVNLIEKRVDGFYHLTSYGKMILIMLQEFDFTSKYAEYFASHVFYGIPSEYIKRIGDLRNSELIVDVLEFIRKTEKIIEDSNEFVYIIVDQFPLNYLRAFNKAFEKGLKIKIIESQNPIFTADISELGMDNFDYLEKARFTPIVESKTISGPSLYMFLTDQTCIFSFPSTNGEIDYRGFLANEENSLKWCKDLFEYFWNMSKSRIKKFEQIPSVETSSIGESIVVEGNDDPSIDSVNIQYAIDNYSEVVLKGDFNIGTSTIIIRRPLVLKGEGRDDNKPLTTIKRQGWTFPSSEYDRLIKIEAEGHDIRIENIHFTDWNNACIYAQSGSQISIVDNRFTLLTILGRGARFGNWGDNVMGILVASDEEGSFQNGVHIEGNYLDFATYYMLGGFRPRLGFENQPDYRPDLMSHENCMSYGILVKQVLGDVTIKNNEVRNMNTESIWVFDNIDSNVIICDNTIVSNVFGSYALNRPYAGYGISAHLHWEASSPHDGFNIKIVRNRIELGKVNYCGIAVHGPLENILGAVRLSGGAIRNNSIFLIDGAVGIHVYRCMEFDISNNNIGGTAYYGIQVIGSEKKKYYDIMSNMNKIEGNDFSDFEIKKSDEYGTNNIDFLRFTGNNEQAKHAHVWLNEYSFKNMIHITENESYIDEGKENSVIYS